MATTSPASVHGVPGGERGGEPGGAAERFRARMCEARRSYPFPLDIRALAEEFTLGVLALLFPHFTRTPRCEQTDLEEEQLHLCNLLRRALRTGAPDADERAVRLAEDFFARLPGIHEALLADARAIYEGDPAAESMDEVILAYPGFLAIACYRIAHVFSEQRVPVFPRLVTEFAHRQTGIDIHPGARIGASFAIDHGTGIVIGETTVIGDRVKIYQGVTLGAASVDKSMARTKRHPTIGDGVVIYANATILGGDTHVGSGSVIGGNSWLTQSVPPNSVVTYSKVERRRGAAGEDDLLEFNI